MNGHFFWLTILTKEFLPSLLTWISQLQALAKDLPWKLKDSRVVEILQAVGLNTLFIGGEKPCVIVCSDAGPAGFKNE